jgi:hypothetical protein
MRMRAEADGAGGVGGQKSPLPGVRRVDGDPIGGDRAAASGGGAYCDEPIIRKQFINKQFISPFEPGNRRRCKAFTKCRRGGRVRAGFRAADQGRY